MRLGSSIRSSRAVLVFSRVFPFRLRYLSLGSRLQVVYARKFSSRSTRPTTHPGSGFARDGRDIGKVRASKSFIKDESELRDWVSDLKAISYRGRITGDVDEPEDRGRSRFKETGSFAMKRQRESDGADFDESTRRRTRKSGEPYNVNSRISRGCDRGLGDDKEKGDNGLHSNRGSEGFKGREVNSAFESRAAEGLKRGGKDLRKISPLMMEDSFDVEADKEEEFVGGLGNLLEEEDSGGDSDGCDNGADEVLTKSKSSLFGSDKVLNGRTMSRSSSGKSESYLSETRFDHCAVSPLSLKAIKDAGYMNMTVVQEATLPVILKGKDVLAKARTGTGKTVAFLLPSIEVVVKSPPIERDQKRHPILVLVICPTRELAAQAAAEADKLLKYHPSIGAQVVIGGTKIGQEQKSMKANPCQILVATPGRLKDHLENTPGFAIRLMGVKVLVLDEADRLLDMGFRKDIEKIIASIPKQRQTLLFSATVPAEVRQICNIALKRDHEIVNTVEEGSEETHSKVQQMHIVAPLDKQFPLLYAILKEHIAADVDYKVLVFCTTAMITRLIAGLLGELNLNVREIHSRKAQNYRTRVSDEFRKSKGLILVTSDVSARGVDYPDVTLVVQVGLPAGREQYIHRLGRTGRKGKDGQGILLLAPWEEFFLSTIKNLPITKAPVPTVDPDTNKKVQRALSHVVMKDKESAYQSWLGYYNSDKTVGRDKCRLVQLANEFSRSMGLDNPPALKKVVLGKMGLKHIPGLRSM